MNEEDQEFTFSSFWKTNLPTRNIFLIILVVYIILSVLSITFSSIDNLTDLFTISEWLLSLVGQDNGRVYAGHVYLIITSIFVHTSILHFLSNSLFLFIYGFRAEERFHSWQYYLIFIVSGMLGGIVTLALGENVISAGASGGIFGLLGANLVLAYQEEKKKAFWVYLGIGAIFLVFSAGINVNMIAHTVGLITGILFPFILKKRKPTVSMDEENLEDGLE
ncbi:MAG: rhomboid family intramembrane serine protease [Candidatus Heimdallarchaeaceae archaeon]